MNSAIVVLQGEPTVCETPVVKLISYDGNISQRRLGESSVHLNEVRQLNHTFSLAFISLCTELSLCLSVCLSLSVRLMNWS